MTTHSKVHDKRIGVYGWVSILTSMIFIIGYFVNEYLNEQNLSRLDRGEWGAYDYLLVESSESFIIVLIVTLGMIAITKWSFAGKLPTKKRLSTTGWTGLLLYTVTFASMLDGTFGGWGIPGRCGGGFTLGNCFLADGLTELVYTASIPIGLILGTILLIVNKRSSKKQVRRLKK